MSVSLILQALVSTPRKFVERFNFEACLRVSAIQFTRGSSLYRELFQFLDEIEELK
jgi:hypothetical protein